MLTDAPICERCLFDLPWLGFHCNRCSKPLLYNTPACADCVRYDFAFDKAHACFRYLSPISDWIWLMKYERQCLFFPMAANFLNQKFNEIYKDNLPDACLPVPLHSFRLRWRGFNQALLLARQMQLPIPVIRREIIRAKSTKRQARIDAKDRQKNVKNAFKVIKPLKYKHILILDDVMTTGATVNSLAKVCRDAGVEKIDVLCLARA